MGSDAAAEAGRRAAAARARVVAVAVAAGATRRLGVSVGHEEEHLVRDGRGVPPPALDARVRDVERERVGRGELRVAVGVGAKDVPRELVEDDDERRRVRGVGVAPGGERAARRRREGRAEPRGDLRVHREARGLVLTARGEPLAAVVLLRARREVSSGGGGGGGESRHQRRWRGEERAKERHGAGRGANAHLEVAAEPVLQDIRRARDRGLLRHPPRRERRRASGRVAGSAGAGGCGRSSAADAGCVCQPGHRRCAENVIRRVRDEQ